MDPHQNLKEQLELARKIVGDTTKHEDYDPTADYLAELVLALDEWIRKGGALPDEWRKAGWMSLKRREE